MKNTIKFAYILFHPLTIVEYGLILLLIVNPYEFFIDNPKDRIILFVQIALLTMGFPLLTILLIHVLEITKNMKLSIRQQRIVPLIISAFFYLWLFVNIRANTYIPPIFISVVLGATIAVFLAFFINNFSRIHLHSVGISSLIVIIISYMIKFESQQFTVNLGILGFFALDLSLFLVIAVLMSGFLAYGAQRFYDYKDRDIYGGAVVGIVSQIVAMMIIL